MDEHLLTLVIDFFTILIGSGVVLNAMIQLLIEFRVRETDGRRSYSRMKILRHLLFLVLGVLVVLLRIWYIVLR